LSEFPTTEAPTEEQFFDLFQRASGIEEPQHEYIHQEPQPVAPPFRIPEWLKYEDGDYAHQGRAVKAWVDAGFRGTLEMATGSGKTLTSLICAYRVYERFKPLFIVVAAPYVPLIEQWCGEILLFGLRPINLTTAGGPADRARILQQLRRRLRLGLSDVEIVVVSHDTLCDAESASAVSQFEAHKMLIADEAHNLGRPSFIANPPAFFDSRLALSATPIRQYDPEGTDRIFEFFGPVVFRFTLKDAIGVCLVEYDYYVHPISLTATEMDDWNELTQRIKQNSWRRTAKGDIDDMLQKLYRDRRALLETAENKIGILSNLLDREDLRRLRHTLVYATDKAPQQLRDVNELLRSRGLSFHQLTEAETSDRKKTMEIIRAFQRGDIQVLTAKRVLDEGVNIPQISRAYILASTTVERQWIQRRGRLLRTCQEIGKTHSSIHDFLALPPVLDKTLDDDTRGLIKSELERAQEFAGLARNAGMPDGALPVIHNILKSAFM
jgi:superfamily II DNA or RNA helicase